MFQYVYDVCALILVSSLVFDTDGNLFVPIMTLPSSLMCIPMFLNHSVNDWIEKIHLPEIGSLCDLIV